MSESPLPFRKRGRQEEDQVLDLPSNAHRQKIPRLSNPTASSSSSSNSVSSAQITAPPNPQSQVDHTNLWLRALGNLSTKDQELIWGLQPSLDTRPFSKNGVEELLDLTRQVLQKSDERSWKFTFRGKVIIARDVLAKIVVWLNRFKDVGDVAVNFDPVHASLPWAGIRFMFQAAIGEHEQMGDLVIAIERLTSLIHRGAIYERLYRPATILGDVIGHLHSAMVDLYSMILRIMILCRRIFAKNAAKRAVHALFHPGEITGLLDKCEELETRVEYEAHNCERTRSQRADAEVERLLSRLQEPVLPTDERVLSLLETATERERLEVLDWTSKVLYGANHRRVRDKRTTNTCEWLLAHQLYHEWQETSASTILWLCGNAGTGKTFLTSKVIDEIRTALENQPNQEAFAFFYCNRNEADRREPLSVLRAFVRQMSTTATDKGSIQKNLEQFYLENRIKASEPTMNDCKKLLLEFINIYPRTTLVLDACDECERHKRLELMDIFDQLLSEASKPVKIFVSSRPDDDIKKKLKDRSNIQINARDNHHDITKFVNSEIGKHPNWHVMSPEIQAQIVDTLQERSQGMFQWAFLQIKQLLDLDLEEDILERLGKLPDDLKQAYDEIYRSMSKAEKRIADRAFRWVMCACHPLSTKLLLAAISQDENSDLLKHLGGLTENLVLKYCHNLLVIDPARGVWVPSHLSVIEYLEKHLWNLSQASCLVSNVCLLVLQNTTLNNREKCWGVVEMDDQTWSPKEINDPDDPLSGQNLGYLSYYARHHWPLHIQSCNDTDTSSNSTRLSSRLKAFLGLPTNSSAAYRCWHRMVEMDVYNYAAPDTTVFYSSNNCEDLNPASMASFAYCAFGLSDILPDWFDFDWVNDEIRTLQGTSFLGIAASSGSISTCETLLEHGAEVDTQTRSYFGSALAAAAYWGKEEVVEFLIREGGADINMQLQHGMYGSALAAAAYWGKKEVVEILIREGGANINMQLQHGIYGSALAAAVSGPYIGTSEVRYLVKEAGAEVNMQLEHGNYSDALEAAERNGNSKATKWLLKYREKRGEEAKRISEDNERDGEESDGEEEEDEWEAYYQGEEIEERQT